MSEPENWANADDEENDPDYVPPAEMENGHITSDSEDETNTSGFFFLFCI